MTAPAERVTPTLPLAPTSCPTCGRSHGPAVFTDRARGAANAFRIIRCPCGLLYVNPAPPSAALAQYYARYETYFDPAVERVKTDQEMMRLADRDLSRIERWRSPGRLLDVGCGRGHFLAAAHARGWAVSGTEFGSRRELEDRARLAGAALHRGELDTFAGHDLFDVITMRQVLEHVAHPRGTLTAARRLLKPDGILFCHVPNVGGLRVRLTRRPMANQLHLWHFTPATLRALLEAVGYRVLAIRSQDHRAVAAAPWAGFIREARVRVENSLLRFGINLGTIICAVASPS